MKESKTDYTLLNSSSPLTTSTSYSPKKVRASCTRLQYVFIITLIVDFISTFAYLSELSFQHFIFVLSNITAEYNIAWNDIDLFFFINLSVFFKSSDLIVNVKSVSFPF